MSIFSYVIWSANPEIFQLPLSLLGGQDRPVVWYGLLFALGFILSQQVLYRIFRQDGQPERDVDTLTTFMVIATILGARLGHCLFYNPSHYLSNPLDILKIWEGGLASHGGAIGILIAIWIYVRFDIKVKWTLVVPTRFKVTKKPKNTQSFLWVLDRLVIVVALTGALIRTGNLMNSEMEGTPTNSNTGLVYARGTKDVLNYGDKVESVTFLKGGDKVSNQPGRVPVTAIMKYARGVEVDELEKQFIETRLRSTLQSYREAAEHISFAESDEPLRYDTYKAGGYSYVELHGIGIVRHPAQMYEAIYCLLLMALLFWVWKNKRSKVPLGFNFALFMIILWSLRFVDEFFKMDQEAFEAEIPLNMGQWLSIPMALAGVITMIVIYTNQKENKGE